ncbi:hypothetical protein TNCV_4920691 [Trichonephila clavipes]|nr:hypothetical protein TNCV_4920691 [Trichonephila clavipes]
MELRVESQRPSITSSRKDRYDTCLNESYSHVMSSQLKMLAISMITSICKNNSTPFAAAWTLSSLTMTAGTFDAASHTRTSSMGGINEPGCNNGETLFLRCF